MASTVVLINKKKDLQDPKNHCPIYVSTTIYGILTRLLLKCMATAMTPDVLDIQHGALSGRRTTTLTAKLVNNSHKTNGYPALLNVAKAFLSVPRTMITDIMQEAGA